MNAETGAEAATPLVTVIMPTHNHAATVDLAIGSVLRQTVMSWELVVVGDGATPAVRDAVLGMTGDERVRFIDGPKTASRAELVRHQVIVECKSPYICYTGDDDILLPDHLESTVQRLEQVDFTHPLPAYVDRKGGLQCHPTDLADPRCREWHLYPGQNAVSLTGVGHRRKSYLKLPHGWREPPPGVWSDHYMWQQWFAFEGFTFATGDRLTVLKFEAAVRTEMGETERRTEMLEWLDQIDRPGFESLLAASASRAFRRSAFEGHLASTYFSGALRAEQDGAVTLRQETAALRQEVAELYQQLSAEREQWEAERERYEVHIRRAAEEVAEVQLSEARAQERAGAAEESERRIRATKTWRAHDGLVRRLRLDRRHGR